MKKAYKAITRLGDGVVITVTALLATVVFLVGMVVDLVRLATPRVH